MNAVFEKSTILRSPANFLVPHKLKTALLKHCKNIYYLNQIQYYLFYLSKAIIHIIQQVNIMHFYMLPFGNANVYYVLYLDVRPTKMCIFQHSNLQTALLHRKFLKQTLQFLQF